MEEKNKEGQNQIQAVIRLDRQLKYTGTILKIYEDTVMANGHEVHWDFIHHDGAAAVVCLLYTSCFRDWMDLRSVGDFGR